MAQPTKQTRQTKQAKQTVEALLKRITELDDDMLWMLVCKLFPNANMGFLEDVFDSLIISHAKHEPGRPLNEVLAKLRGSRMPTIRAKAGMRVRVFSADMKRDLGLATIMRVEPLIDEQGRVVSNNYPSEILLDTGELTEGMRCWWYPDAWDKEHGQSKV